MNLALRIGAFVLAVGLVVGALVFRGGRDGGEVADGPTEAGVGSASGDDGDGLVCPSDLATLCSTLTEFVPELTVTGGATAATADAWIAGDERGTWLVPSAWADLVDDARTRAGRTPMARSEVVAHTPLLLVVWEDRGAVLASRCGVTIEEVTWSCVGDQADMPWSDIGGDVRWGRVVPGHAAPDTTLGLQATAAVAAGRLGTDFTLADLREAGFSSWFRNVERAVTEFSPAGGSHVVAMVSRGPSVADVAVATEAELQRVAQRDNVFGALRTLPAEPLLAVELVVVGADDGAVQQVADALDGVAGRTGFDRAGWRTTDTSPTGGSLGPLPPFASSPSGGSLTAMRSIWAELVG